MKQQVVYSKERKGYEKHFLLDNVQYSIGVGGIHSIHTPKIYKPNDDEYIGHSDVASMYPSFIIQYKWIPSHLGNAFYEVYKRIYEERIEAKHTGQKLKNLALKLTLNSVTGKMQQETSWMYDPFRVFKIRINGQLVLLMLVDRLLKRGCKIIQVNTDGVMYIAKKANKQLILEDIHEVEQITKLTFETDEYQSFYQYAVNDYFGITTNGEVEKKGMFITTTNLGKGLSPVIIPKAVINYFITGEKVSEYIKRQTDIKDFLMCQRADKKFKVKHGNKQVQRINRYYASINDYHIYKVDEEGKEIDMLTSSGVTILNRMDEKPIEDRKINYEYYIHEANEIIANFIYQQLELFW
jgi:DNA polymerase elongation subunit (family B)